MTRRRGRAVLDAALLVGALVSIFGVVSLISLPWSLPVLAVLTIVEMAFYRRLRAERGEA